MEFIETYDNNYQCDVYTLEGKYITLTICREHIYKNNEWAQLGNWEIIFYIEPYTDNINGRSVLAKYKTLKESKKRAMNYMTLFHCEC